MKKKRTLLNCSVLFLSIGVSGGSRTPDPQLRRLLFYPTELRTRNSNIDLRRIGSGTEGYIPEINFFHRRHHRRMIQYKKTGTSTHTLFLARMTL